MPIHAWKWVFIVVLIFFPLWFFPFFIFCFGPSGIRVFNYDQRGSNYRYNIYILIYFEVSRSSTLPWSCLYVLIIYCKTKIRYKIKEEEDDDGATKKKLLCLLFPIPSPILPRCFRLHSASPPPQPLLSSCIYRTVVSTPVILIMISWEVGLTLGVWLLEGWAHTSFI